MARTWVPVSEAARLMQVSQLTLRNMMVHKDINIGMAVKNEGSPQWHYLISPKLLNDELERLGLSERYEKGGER